MKFLKYPSLVFLLWLLTSPVAATKSQGPLVTGKGLVNGRDIDLAQTRASAIPITNPRVTFRGEITNNTGSTLNLTKVKASYAAFLPDKEFSFRETVPSGQTKSKTITARLPGWVLNLKGYYQVTATIDDERGNQVLRKDFWVYLGTGSPLTGMPGIAGTAVAAVGVATGAGVIRDSRPPKPGRTDKDKPRRRRNLLRGVSTVAMIMAILMLFLIFGLIDFQSGLFGIAAFGAAAGLSYNVLVQLLIVAVNH